MTALWAGHDFDAADLEFWAGEIAAAATEVSEADREPFLSIACAGSQRLQERARALVANAWAPAPAPAFIGLCRAGDIVRDCIILRPIGRGGMGEVYRAIQRSVRRLVAVKVVTDGADRVSLEAANAARLLHPNIVAVHDADPRGVRPAIVMELVEGVSLRTWLEGHWQKHQEPAPLPQVQAIIREIALALGEAHRHGLVHLDVKPENVLLTKRDGNYTIKVADFGIARRVETPSGGTMGTAGYMAPEQVKAKRADARADLFALGVILYEMLTGKQPFAGRSPAETYFNTLSLEPVFPHEQTLARIVAVARKALQKSPEQRYQTAQELIGDLDDLADDTGERSESASVGVAGRGSAMVGAAAVRCGARIRVLLVGRRDAGAQCRAGGGVRPCAVGIDGKRPSQLRDALWLRHRAQRRTVVPRRHISGASRGMRLAGCRTSWPRTDQDAADSRRTRRETARQSRGSQPRRLSLRHACPGARGRRVRRDSRARLSSRSRVRLGAGRPCGLARRRHL